MEICFHLKRFLSEQEEKKGKKCTHFSDEDDEGQVSQQLTLHSFCCVKKKNTYLCNLKEKKTHLLSNIFTMFDWVCCEWPGLHSIYALYVYTVGQEETDHKPIAVVCDSKALLQLAVYF